MKRFFLVLLVVGLFCFLLCPAYAVVPEQDTLSDHAEALTYVGSYQSDVSSDGLKGVLLDFIGEWESVTVLHDFVDSSGNVVTQVESLPDYPWIASACLLCLMVFCLFKLGGGMLCKV